MKIFRLDGPVQAFFEKTFHLMVLQLLFVVCSLPIVTIGASVTALLSVTMKMSKDEEGYVWKDFLKAFRSNFKQSTCIWLIFAATISYLLFMLRVSMISGATVLKVMEIPEAALLVIVIAALLYVFALQARFENTVKNTIRNSFLVSLRCLPQTALLFIILFGSIILTGFSGSAYGLLLFVWIFCGFSLLAYISSYVYVKVFESWK